MQEPLQFVVPGGQVQAPLMQTRPGGHFAPQAPQLAGSVVTLVQIPLQLTRPFVQVDEQVPFTQT